MKRLTEQQQRAVDGQAVHLARNKTNKELGELFNVAGTHESKALVRFAKKLKRQNERDKANGYK